VIKFRGDSSRMSGVVEVRGIVNKDGTISYGEFTQYDNEFGKYSFLSLSSSAKKPFPPFMTLNK
jgi:hypothetical protein